MKSFAIVAVLATACVALAVANPVDVESIEPVNEKGAEESSLDNGDASVRDKRTLLLGAAAYAAPVAYSAYAAPLAYSAYSAPYATYPVAYSAYSAYNPYPYYAASSYYVV